MVKFTGKMRNELKLMKNQFSGFYFLSYGRFCTQSQNSSKNCENREYDFSFVLTHSAYKYEHLWIFFVEKHFIHLAKKKSFILVGVSPPHSPHGAVSCISNKNSTISNKKSDEHKNPFQDIAHLLRQHYFLPYLVGKNNLKL